MGLYSEKVDGELTVVDGAVSEALSVFPQVRGGAVDGDNGDNGGMERSSNACVCAGAPARGARMRFHRQPVVTVNPETGGFDPLGAGTDPFGGVPVTREGHAAVAGREGRGWVHRLYIARPSRKVAVRTGLSQNHHIRLWCECQSGQASDPGELPNGLYWREDRSVEQHMTDPRRLGGWDHFAVADTRSGDAIALFRDHVEREEGITYEQAVSRGLVHRATR